MVVIDANILVYAYNVKAPNHLPAQRWLSEMLASEEVVGLPIPSVLAFLRISTHPQLSGHTFAYAVNVVEGWLSLPNVSLLSAGSQHWSIFKQLVVDAGIGANLSTDAHMAALALEYDALLCSTDRDFDRFPGLRWMNPLAHG